jgi:hypothetical protein
MKFVLIVLGLTVLTASAAGADPSYRFYDRSGRYEGRAEPVPYSQGEYRFYDRSGEYQGRAEPVPYGQGEYRFYDSKGRFQGRSVPTPGTVPAPPRWGGRR